MGDGIPTGPIRPGWLRSASLSAALLLVSWIAGSLAAAAECMPASSERALAFRSTVVYNLGSAGAAPAWNCWTLIPTLASFGTVRSFARRLGLSVEAWLYNDGAAGDLERCQGSWRPAVAALAADHRRAGGVPSVADSVAAFNLHVRPLERAQRTRSKYVTHSLSILTWGIWKGCFARLLPMSDDMVRAYVWDCLAFEASHSVLKHALDAIKAWHQRLGVRVPLDGHGDYRRITHSLGRFQPTPQIIKFPIHAEAVKRLLTLQLPAHPKCAGVRPPTPRGRWTRCPICWLFLLCWFDCPGWPEPRAPSPVAAAWSWVCCRPAIFGGTLTS